MCSIAFRCSQRGPDVTLNGTRNSMMETKVPNFVSTMSRTIKCNHCSKLFVNQQGLFYTVKLKTYNCIVFADVSTHKIMSFQNLSLGFILKIFLKFREFQPRYSYKIYSYKIYSYKKECSLTFEKCHLKGQERLAGQSLTCIDWSQFFSQARRNSWHSKKQQKMLQDYFCPRLNYKYTTGTLPTCWPTYY